MAVVFLVTLAHTLLSEYVFPKVNPPGGLADVECAFFKILHLPAVCEVGCCIDNKGFVRVGNIFSSDGNGYIVFPGEIRKAHEPDSFD